MIFAIVALIALAALVFIPGWRRRRSKSLTMEEWLERLRKLDEKIPLEGPKFKSRYTRTGAPGVCRPEPKPVKAPIEIKKKAR